MTPEAIIGDIVTFELANMFGKTGDSTDLDATERSEITFGAKTSVLNMVNSDLCDRSR
jgi:hypothetical protein